MLKDLSGPSPFVNALFKNWFKIIIIKWQWWKYDDNCNFLLSDAELSLAEVGSEHLGIASGRKFIKLLVEMWFVKIENMICENWRNYLWKYENFTVYPRAEGWRWGCGLAFLGSAGWQFEMLPHNPIVGQHILDI